jgi:TCP-1/cpn60 chaperonin family
MASMHTASECIPVIVLKEISKQSSGSDAQRNNISAAQLIAEIVSTSLGPRGMDKMLVDSVGDITITNDGTTILKEIDVQHPAVKMLLHPQKVVCLNVPLLKWECNKTSSWKIMSFVRDNLTLFVVYWENTLIRCLWDYLKKNYTDEPKILIATHNASLNKMSFKIDVGVFGNDKEMPILQKEFNLTVKKKN